MTQWRWDPRKDHANRRKHRLSFAFAARVFDDPLALSKIDESSTEERWITMGMVEGVVILVVHTWQDRDAGEPEGRIISARKATRHERKAYEESGS